MICCTHFGVPREHHEPFGMLCEQCVERLSRPGMLYGGLQSMPLIDQGAAFAGQMKTRLNMLIERARETLEAGE